MMQEQKTTRFVTPFGHIEVLKNGELMPFSIKKGSAVTFTFGFEHMHLDDNTVMITP